MKRLAVSVLLVGLALTMWAEEIVLKDGTKVTGKILYITGDTFQVQTSYGEIKIPRAEIVSINFPENQPKDGSSGPSSAPVEESLKNDIYTNGTTGFQLTVPNGWRLAPEMRNSDIQSALKSADETQFLLVVPEKFAGTLATYQVLVETVGKKNLKDYETLEKSDVQIDGIKSLRAVWHAKNPQVGDTPMKGVNYTIPYEGRVVRLSFLTLEPFFPEAVPVFEKIAMSYKTVKQK